MIKENQNFLNKINAATDIIILFLSMTFAYLIRFYIFKTRLHYFETIRAYNKAAYQLEFISQ